MGTPFFSRPGVQGGWHWLLSRSIWVVVRVVPRPFRICDSEVPPSCEPVLECTLTMPASLLDLHEDTTDSIVVEGFRHAARGTAWQKGTLSQSVRWHRDHLRSTYGGCISSSGSVPGIGRCLCACSHRKLAMRSQAAMPTTAPSANITEWTGSFEYQWCWNLGQL